MNDRIPAWIDGVLTPVDKIEVHRRGLRHPAVSVFVMDGGDTLIQRRADAKYHTPGLWANACCTHPHWAETPAACAQRRLAEELGLTAMPMTWRERVEYRAPVGCDLIEHEVVDIFVTEAATGTPVSPDPAEVSEVRWIALEELGREIAAHPERFSPWLRIYLADHQDKIFGAAA